MQVEELAGVALEEGIFELLRQRLVQVIPVAAPAAGADWSKVVPAGLAWELLAVTGQLATSAAVANRQVSLQAKDANANLLGQGDAANVQAASLTRRYIFEPLLGTPSAVVVQRNIAPAIGYALTEGMQLNSLTAAIDVADQWSQVVLVVRQWSLTDVAFAAEWYRRREYPL